MPFWKKREAPVLEQPRLLAPPADEFTATLRFVKKRSYCYEFVRTPIPMSWFEDLKLGEGHGNVYSSSYNDEARITVKEPLTQEQKDRATEFLGRWGFHYVRTRLEESVDAVDRPDYHGSCTVIDGEPYPVGRTES